jgi:gas vesicle protein
MLGCNKSNNFIWGAILGGAVGTLATMLFTTKKGKEIRKNIADKYHELENEFKDTADNLEDSAEHQAKKVADKFKKNDSKG